MQTMTSPAASPARDFSKPIEPITFTCDGVTYRAPRVLNPVNLKRVVAAISQVDLTNEASLLANFDQVAPILAEVLKALIPGQGGEHLATRLLAQSLGFDEMEADPDAVRPLDLLGQALPIMVYVIEELGLRPTTPPSPLSDGSMAGTTDTPSDGTSSTAGASPTESVPAN
jgi:hypothetical protein